MGRADALSKQAWKRLERKAKYKIQTEPRRRSENVKEAVVIAREFDNIRLLSEDVAEFDYSPTACKKIYRMVAVRKEPVHREGRSAAVR